MNTRRTSPGPKSVSRRGRADAKGVICEYGAYNNDRIWPSTFPIEVQTLSPVIVTRVSTPIRNRPGDGRRLIFYNVVRNQFRDDDSFRAPGFLFDGYGRPRTGTDRVRLPRLCATTDDLAALTLGPDNVRPPPMCGSISFLFTASSADVAFDFI